MNQINVIRPYYLDELETWVFDDGNKELIQEPFVAGVPEMIELLTEGFPNRRDGFRLLFSESPLPKDHMDEARFARLTFFEEELGGAWYVGKYEGLHMEGWLCPALRRYYPAAFPMFLYIAAMAFPIIIEKPKSKFLKLIGSGSEEPIAI
jgi:hypothetical protein